MNPGLESEKVKMSKLIDGHKRIVTGCFIKGLPWLRLFPSPFGRR